MNNFIDTHCHLNMVADKLNCANLDAVFATMPLVPEIMLQVACHPDDFTQSAAWLEQYPQIFGAFGVHPHDANLYTSELEAHLRQLLSHPKAVAVGEAGLDYHYMISPAETQKHAFARQISLAQELGKPLVVHTREAEADTWEILQEFRTFPYPIHIHCYTAGLEFAQKLRTLDLDLYFGFTGIITFKNSEDIRAVAEYLPLDRILSETDAPFLAPVPFRGKTATPAMVEQVVATLAEIKGISIQKMAEHCNNNARACYGL